VSKNAEQKERQKEKKLVAKLIKQAQAAVPATPPAVVKPVVEAPQLKHDVAEETKTPDPAKRVRNLKKKLREIEQLEELDSDTLTAPQLEKIQKKQEVEKEIELLERGL
jgi:hypothetical protein